MPQCNWRVSESLKAALEAEAAQAGWSVTQLVAFILEHRPPLAQLIELEHSERMQRLAGTSAAPKPPAAQRVVKPRQDAQAPDVDGMRTCTSKEHQGERLLPVSAFPRDKTKAGKSYHVYTCSACINAARRAGRRAQHAADDSERM